MSTGGRHTSNPAGLGCELEGLLQGEHPGKVFYPFYVSLTGSVDVLQEPAHVIGKARDRVVFMSLAETIQEVEIREMELEDIPEVYRLGNQLFHSPEFTTLYRTWDAYEVTTNFNQDPRLSLVAEAANGKIVGFALGTTYEKERRAWKYGHVVWLGVDPDYQRRHVGSRLYQEDESYSLSAGLEPLCCRMATTSSSET